MPDETQEPRERTYLADMNPGDLAEDIFILQNVQLKENKKGDPYLTMLVSDRSRGVTANWWDQGEAMFRRLPNPGVVKVKGRIELFNGHPQIKVDKILQLRNPDRVDYGELLPSTEFDIDTMFDELSKMLRDMQSPTLRSLAEAYLADEELMTNFRRAPAAMGMHHAYLGGLLEHTLNAMRAAAALAPLYPKLNADLCVFGVFIHDLAKTWELTYETAFDYSTGGRLVGHVAKAAMWVEDKSRAAEVNVPRELIDVLQHIILSHHGELSLGFGSAKSPATPEAIFVHHVENLDAKMTMALAATRRGRAADDPAEWTPWTKGLDGRMYKPDVVARADASSVENEDEPAPTDPSEDPTSPAPLFQSS
jgi:3'-5' exoribonuclease